eukprot:TRINITY_DN918_c0_g1_i1.p1 TRINITY_DN918_c0_g1~~TRINITY_DN918_c0_g1_i1.p1  ORF type:complete len:790 (+),score=217.87 TRINITY_DN918_c0_g1_i1:46-2415(+)
MSTPEEIQETINGLEEEVKKLVGMLAEDPGCERLKGLLAVRLVDLGTNYRKMERHAEGVKQYEMSLTYNPSYGSAYYNLGVAAADEFRPIDALEHYEKTLECNPVCIEALCNIGVIRKQLGELEIACTAFERALRIRPNHPLVLQNYAIALSDLGTRRLNADNDKEAKKYYKKAIRANPFYHEAYYNLGVLSSKANKAEDAIYYYQMALHFKPDYPQAWNNLGVVFKETGCFEQAVECLDKAITLDTTLATTMNNLAVLISAGGQLDKAQSLLRKAVELQPLYAEAWNNLGVVMRDEGIMWDALNCYEKCLSMCPEAENAAQNRLLALNFSTEHTVDEVQEAHLEWGKRIAAKHATRCTLPAPSPENKNKKIRVGYVSPDFYLHSVSYFIHNPLKYHDQNKFEIFCFSNVVKPDSKTFAFKKLVPEENWVDIVGQDMHAAAATIQSHNIDILVDLTGHTGTSRLDIFTLKPAPVQVSWIGYPNTTGLPTIDYRFTDEVVDPWDEVKDEHYAEVLYRLPGSFLCYCPDTEKQEDEGEEDKPKPASFQTPLEMLDAEQQYSVNYRGDLPPVIPQQSAIVRNGYVTYGTFNNMAKINDEVVKVWCEIMKKVPDCRFLLKSKPFAEKRVRDQMLERFKKYGGDPARVELMGIIPQHYNHLQTYEKIDIALDCWPYAGTTTSCEAMWMGVPMVTLRGKSHASNVGASLLMSVKCPELIAHTTEEYVKIATELATPENINKYRGNLQRKMAESILCNGEEFTRNVETAYTKMWNAHCDGEKVNQRAELGIEPRTL